MTHMWEAVNAFLKVMMVLSGVIREDAVSTFQMVIVIISIVLQNARSENTIL